MRPSRQWVNCWPGEERRALTGGGHNGGGCGFQTIVCVGGQWFPSIDKEAIVERIQTLESLCNPPWPGGGSGQEETSGGYPYMVHVLHDLYCHGRD